MSKHTPGPWVIEENHEECYGSLLARWLILAKEGHGYALATAITDTDELRLEGEANARLIAAAPDLLLELTRLSREVGGILYGFELELREAIGNTNFAVLKQKVKEADAAIHKAEDQ